MNLLHHMIASKGHISFLHTKPTQREGFACQDRLRDAKSEVVSYGRRPYCMYITCKCIGDRKASCHCNSLSYSDLLTHDGSGAVPLQLYNKYIYDLTAVCRGGLVVRSD